MEDEDRDISDDIKRISEPTQCSVCLEYVYLYDKTQIKLTNCGHLFHSECLSGLAENCDIENNLAKELCCPNCRKDIEGVDCISALSNNMRKITTEIKHFEPFLERFKLEHDKLVCKTFRQFLKFPEFDVANPNLYLTTKLRRKQKLGREIQDFLYYNKSLQSDFSELFD